MNKSLCLYSLVLLTLLSQHFSAFASPLPGTLSGRVHGSTNTTPLIAAVIHIEGTTLKATSNLQGEYSFSAIPPGTYTVRAEISGFAPEIIRSVRIRENKPATHDIIFNTPQHNSNSLCDSCPPPSVILGKITDTENQPVSEVAVTLLGSARTTTSGSDGLFSFTALPNGAYSLALSHPQFKTDTITELAVEQGVVQDIIIALRPLKTLEEITGILSGQVSDSATSIGVPKASVSLLNTDYTTLTDENGTYTLPALIPGTYSLLITRWGYEALVLSGVTIETAKTTVHSAVLSPRQAGAFSADGPLGSISGIISDARGEPVANAHVWLRDSERRGYSNMVGHYQFDSIPSGVYQLMSTAEGFDTALSADSDIWSGEMTSLNLTLTRRSQGVKVGEIALEDGKGAVGGVVLDGKSSEALAGVTVHLSELKSAKAVTDLQGRYLIANVKPGSYTVSVAHNGFVNATTPIIIGAAKVSQGDFLLNPSEETQMTRMSIRSVRIANTGAALLKERQQAISFTDAIGSQEMSRSGASNAADAMKSVTGATVMGGKYVYVRGLGERYTTTMLNDAELPSPNPDKKAVAMDLFPSSLLENIITDKTFTPDKPGNFTGGSINIRTKTNPDRQSISLSASTSANSQTHWAYRKEFLTYEGGSLDWLGIDDGTRALPSQLLHTSQQDIPSLQRARRSSNQEEFRKLNEYSKAFSPVMAPHTAHALLDHSFAAAYGNRYTLANRPLSVMGSLSYARKQFSYKDGLYANYEQKLRVATIDNMDGALKKLLTDDQSVDEVLWGGIASASLELSDYHTLQLSYLMAHNAEDETRFLYGFNDDLSGGDNRVFESRTLHYTERDLHAPQLRGKHSLGRYHDFSVNWLLSYISSQQDEPDMRLFADDYDKATGAAFDIDNAVYDLPTRYYRDLTENNFNSSIDLELPLSLWHEENAALKWGTALQLKTREFNERRFVIRQDDLRYDGNALTWFSEKNYGYLGHASWNTDLRDSLYVFGHYITDASERKNSYTGSELIYAGYGMLKLPLIRKATAVLGIRYEGTSMDVKSKVPNGLTGTLNKSDLLPALAITVPFAEKMQLRSAYGRTLARPTLREKAPFSSFSFIGGEIYNGNSDLQRTIINNFDVRWEYFPNVGEIITTSVFFKHFNKPIELTRVDDNGNVKPINVDEAIAMGAELEARFGLPQSIPVLRNFKLSGNILLANSFVRIAPIELEQKRALDPHAPDSRPFQGQSPFVANSDITFDFERLGTSGGLFFNIFGKRISKVSSSGTPDVYELPSPELDFTLSQKIGSKTSLKIGLKNILNSPKKEVMTFKGKDYTYQEYLKGREFKLGLNVVL